MTTKTTKTRKTSHKESLSDHIYKHSPIKRGIVVKNEDKPLHKYNKIMSKIYLGNVQACKDKEIFKDCRFKAVLNCSKDIPNTFMCSKVKKGNETLEAIEYLRIPIDDSLKEIDFEKAYLMMPLAVEFIHKHAVILKQNILIHCWAGRQRSAIMIAAYLVAKCGFTPKQACRLIAQKRPESWHHSQGINFETSLEKYYKDLQKGKKRSIKK